MTAVRQRNGSRESISQTRPRTLNPNIAIAESQPYINDTSRRGLAPSPTCLTAARWLPRKWDVAVSTANIAGLRQASLYKEGSLTALVPHKQQSSLITRRSIFIGAAASLICAPAIVRVTSLMPVRRLPPPFGPQYAGFVERLYLHALDRSLRAGLRAGQTSIHFNGKIFPAADAQRTVARARDYGWLPPYISIFRND
jgi:hypothetical protein